MPIMIANVPVILPHPCISNIENTPNDLTTISPQGAMVHYVSEDKAAELIAAAPAGCNNIHIEMRQLLGRWASTAVDEYEVQDISAECAQVSWCGDDAHMEAEADFLARGHLDDDDDDAVVGDEWEMPEGDVEIGAGARSADPAEPAAARSRARRTRRGDQSAREDDRESGSSDACYDYVFTEAPGNELHLNVASFEPVLCPSLKGVGKNLMSRWLGGSGSSASSSGGAGGWSEVSGQVWEDSSGRAMGKALFAGNDNIRVYCYCHAKDFGLNATNASKCGSMIYCRGVWEHVGEILEWCLFVQSLC